jgi:SH3 domain-containing YSC84-like protein 1
MSKRILLSIVLIVSAVLPVMAASSRSDDVSRIRSATDVFREVMATPDKAIPQDLLSDARCIAIIPGEKKAAFIVGGKYGKGLVTCRTPRGWSAPAFLAIGGGSYGFQIGGSSTDIVMVFTNIRGLDSLLSDKFKIGANAEAAAGPVGRYAAASTDIKLHSEILTYSRSRGLFGGVSLDGSVVQPDSSGNEALYGDHIGTKEIVDGHVPVPMAAHPLIRDLVRYSGH